MSANRWARKDLAACYLSSHSRRVIFSWSAGSDRSEHLGSRVSPRVATGTAGDMSDEPDAGAAPAEEVRTHHGIEPPNPARRFPRDPSPSNTHERIEPLFRQQSKALTPSFLPIHPPTVNNRN